MIKALKILGWLVATLFVVWCAGSLYFLLNGRDADCLDETAQSKAVVADGDNAYPIFEELARARQTNCNFAAIQPYRNLWTNSVELASAVDELVTAHSNLFSCVERIVACKGYSTPDDVDPDYSMISMYNTPVTVLYKFKARRAAERGDLGLARRTILRLMDYGLFLENHGGLLGNIVGNSCVGNAMEESCKAPVAGIGDEKWLEDMSAKIDDYESNALIRLSRAFEKENDYRLPRYVHLLSTNETMKAEAMSWCGNNWFEMLTRSRDPASELKLIGKQALVKTLLCFPGYRDYAFRTKETLDRSKAYYRDMLENLKIEVYNPRYVKIKKPVVNPLKRNWLGEKLAAQSMGDVYKWFYKQRFFLRTMQLRCAFEIFKLKHGSYPVRLDELVPSVLDAVPLDPYDGKPIRYNSDHRYFWTPGPDGNFNGKVDFSYDGYPLWKNKNYHFVQLLDNSRRNPPPAMYRKPNENKKKRNKPCTSN